jgi:glycine/D-amino acid oxidase-like deaminating enzyme
MFDKRHCNCHLAESQLRFAKSYFEGAGSMSMMKQQLRRDLLKTLGAGAMAASLAGCAPMATTSPSYPRPYSRKPWVAPRISMDNVIRSIVGLRPYRPSGFVVKSEQFDDKVVVHNYGHGGGGITLSWGSSALAVRETLGMEQRDAAVVGGGVMGLTSARLLQDAGWNVTIYTKNVARHSTSNVAAGQWFPASVYDKDVATDAFISQFNWATRVSHHAQTNLGGADYGIRWVENYFLGIDPFDEDGGIPFLADLFPYFQKLQPDEHPFPVPHVWALVTMHVDPAVFLRRLTNDFYQAGGRIVMRDFRDRSEVLALEEPVIFNCTGLGAKALFGDDELTPVKGQLVFLPPDLDVDYAKIGGGNELLYMFSRSDAIVLGGTTKKGDWSTQPEPAETARIVAGHQRLFSNFG